MYTQIIKLQRLSINLILMVVMLLMLMTAPLVLAASSALSTELLIPLYKSDILKLEKDPARVSVANPDIADIVLLRGEQVHIVGKSLGTTNVVFWDDRGRIFQSVDIEVTHDLASLKKKLHMMMPNEAIKVYSAQEKLIVEGPVSSATNISAAIKVAEGYLSKCESSGSSGSDSETPKSSDADVNATSSSCGGAEVVNLLSVVGAQQILLEVKVAEMSRTFLRSLDTNLNVLDFGTNQRFGAVNGGASWPNLLVDNNEVPFVPGGIGDGSSPVVGPSVDKFDPNTPSISDKGLFFQDLVGDTFFQAALELSRSKGLAKVLAEPNLTTLTGRSAEFLSGGEFPVPVPQDGRTSIVFKDYGVKVKFLPTILDRGRISLDLDIVVSELSQGRQVDVGTTGSSGVFLIPSLTKRGVSSTVELANGQTIGIAGLIQDNVREVISSLPGLGDIPILGQLFRSQSFVSGQTELVIFVTAHLAKPIAADQIKLPTDSFVPPSDLEFYLLGRMESRSKKKNEDAVAQNVSLGGGVDGLSFGHDL